MGDEAARATGRTYSARLGELTSRQIQAALSRFDLGEFVEATPVTQGLFGQNVFIASTTGQYVLRGTPHYPWQFPKERFGATLLHERTQVPVAYPYLLDPSNDIFGWSYLLVPRMSGISPTDSRLTKTDQVDVARAMGQNLVQMHTLTWAVSGDYDLASNTIRPFGGGFAQWFISDLRHWLTKAQTHGAITTGDVAWTERVIGDAQSALLMDFQPCFVMNDHNPNNVVVDRAHGEWRVTGLFDLMEYYFGDNEADLVRLMAVHMDAEQPHGAQLAHAFGAAYLESRPPRPGFAERYRLYMLRDRLIVWEYGTRPGMNWFPEGQSFCDYAERYMAGHRLLEPDAT